MSIRLRMQDPSLLLGFLAAFFYSAATYASAASCPLPQQTLSGATTNLRKTALRCSNGLSEDAVAVRDGLRAEGFNCGGEKAENQAAASGFRCRGRLPGYSQPVNIYVPGGFHKEAPVTLAYHFTGFTNLAEFNPFTKTNGDYGSYLTKSKKNSLMIIPESTGKDTTYSRELNSPAKMNHFFNQIDQALNRADVSINGRTPIVLSGHSGAAPQLARMGVWAASGQVPALRNVRAIGLFDSVFTPHIAGLVDFENVMKANGKAVYYCPYNPGGTNAAHLRALKASLKMGADTDIKFIRNGSIEHMSFMHHYMTSFLDEAID